MYSLWVKLLWTALVAPAILSPASRTGDKIAGATGLALLLWQGYRKKTHGAAGNANSQSRGADHPAKVAFNARLLAFRCARTFVARAQAKGLRLKIAIDAGVPRLVRADRSRIFLALASLVDNAVKFTQEGVIRLEVVLAAENGRPHLRFTIYDTGAGIDSETLAWLLGSDGNTFFPGHGLSITRHMVASMGGTLGAESEPRGGSTFWFSVPAEIVEAAPAAQPRPLHQPATPDVAISPSLLLPGAPHPTKRVLVVDADAVAQVATLWGVRTLGYSAEAVSTGRAALETWQGAPFDLVLLNCAMVDAAEIIKGIRRLETGCVPIVALRLAAANSTIAATAIDGSLARPVCLMELARTLDHWLGDSAPAYTSEASSDKLSLPV